MLSLRQHLKRPHTWLALWGLLLTFGIVDALRAPESQWLAAGYVALVHGYQRFARPFVARHVRCRYRPSCSEYSAEAVTRFGIAPGLRMTVRRIRSCTGEVPMGTEDPVPGGA